jgi:hypothetical protein
MYCEKLNLSETGHFPKILFDYLDGKQDLSPFTVIHPKLLHSKHV